MATKKSVAAGPATKGLKVRALRPNGIRRAGRFFPAEDTVVALSDLASDDVQAIKDEPLLAVAEVDIEAPPAS